MGIESISLLNNINTLSAFQGAQNSSKQTSQTQAIPFQSLFEEAINDVKDTDATLQEEIYKLATGQTDSVHDVTIASTQASLSVDLLVKLRNSALESYNQIMNISL